MDHDYSKRGYLLPSGSKDLIDVAALHSGLEFVETVAQDDGLVITASLPDLRSDHIEIVIEGRQLRIALKRSDGQAPRKDALEIPASYDITRARATCVKDTLRIFIPKESK
jgi:HSP20 family molecular chaperone IbpA